MKDEGLTEHRTPNTDHHSIGGAVAWILGLSIMLGWLPIVGPFLAGWVGGRRLRDARRALLAALIPAALWAGFLFWAAGQGIKTGKDTLFLDFLRPMALLTAAAQIGGALAGAGRRGPSLVGLLLLVAGLIWFAPLAREAWPIVQMAMQTARERPRPEEDKACPDRLKKLYDAVLLYTDSWDGYLPPADRWMTALTDRTQPFAEEEWLHCPEVSRPGDTTFGYAMNVALGGKRIGELKDREKTPLFYDSNYLEKDAHDRASSLPVPGRHAGRNNIVYANGRVETVAPGIAK